MRMHDFPLIDSQWADARARFFFSIPEWRTLRLPTGCQIAWLVTSLLFSVGVTELHLINNRFVEQM